MQINILKNGELVRDTGILYFYQLLRELEEDERIKPELHRNRVSFDIPEGFDMKKALFTQIVDKKLYHAFVRDLKIGKLADDNLVGELINIPIEQLSKFLEEAKVPSNKMKKIIDKSQKIYFPYLRNSIKFGANSGEVVDFHKCLNELLRLFLDNLFDKRERLDLYGIGSCCSVCQENIAPFYDITYKYEIEAINNVKPQDRKVRTDSKYLYTFKGRENNTFSNYGRVNQASSICFECEFFNLMFLLYIKAELPQYLVMTDSLKITYLLQRKIQMKKDMHIDQAFYYHVASLGRSSKVQLYKIVRDSKKGILLQMAKIIEYDSLKSQLLLMDILDKFSFLEPAKGEDKKKFSDNDEKRVALINHVRKNIMNGNHEVAYHILLDNVITGDEMRFAHNYKLLGEFFLEIFSGSVKEEEQEKMMDQIRKRGKVYWHFGNSFSHIENKKNLGFQLTQLLRSDNRTRMFDILGHLYFTNSGKGKSEDNALPQWLSEDILYSSSKEYHYYVGQLIQGLMAAKKEVKN